MRFNKPLKVFKLKDFEKILADFGFYFHHQKATHRIYANTEYLYVTVPVGKHGEVNAMMSTLTLQRINHNLCKKLDVDTINRYNQ